MEINNNPIQCDVIRDNNNLSQSSNNSPQYYPMGNNNPNQSSNNSPQYYSIRNNPNQLNDNSPQYYPMEINNEPIQSSNNSPQYNQMQSYDTMKNNNELIQSSNNSPQYNQIQSSNNQTQQYCEPKIIVTNESQTSLFNRNNEQFYYHDYNLIMINGMLYKLNNELYHHYETLYTSYGDIYYTPLNNVIKSNNSPTIPYKQMELLSIKMANHISPSDKFDNFLKTDSFEHIDYNFNVLIGLLPIAINNFKHFKKNIFIFRNCRTKHLDKHPSYNETVTKLKNNGYNLIYERRIKMMEDSLNCIEFKYVGDEINMTIVHYHKK